MRIKAAMWGRYLYISVYAKRSLPQKAACGTRNGKRQRIKTFGRQKQFCLPPRGVTHEPQRG